MTVEKLNAYRSLIGDIEDKVTSIDNIVIHKIFPLGQEIQEKSGKIPEEKLMALAGYLHHFYTGIEDILTRIIKIIDGYMPKSGDWHHELLYISSRKTPGVRPAIISTDMYEILNDYRAFRHVFRHAYAKELRWKKMDHLTLNIKEVWSSFTRSINVFIDFLNKLIQEIEKRNL